MQESGVGSVELEEVVSLLGGREVLGGHPRTALDAHDLLVRGLPGRCAYVLVKNLAYISQDENLSRVLGMSHRTYQRKIDRPLELLSQEQSGRTWKFAEILAKATAVFGSQAGAEKWLQAPATGLDRRRPIELLATPAGVELVEDHLTRLEYGVYA